MNDRSGTDAQDTGRVADPASVEAHVDHVLLHVGYTPFVGRIEQKGGMSAIGILAPIVLFPGVDLAAFHDLIMVTVRTKNWHEYHRIPLQHSLSEEGISMAHTPEKVQI